MRVPLAAARERAHCWVAVVLAVDWHALIAQHTIRRLQCSERIVIGLYHGRMVCCMCLARHNAFSGHVAPARSYQDTAKLQLYLQFLGKA